MRTFIAIPLTPEAHALLEGVQAKLGNFGAEVRWVSTNAIHLTLKFLGQVNPVIIPEMAALLRAEPLGRSFSLRLGGIGGFPNLRSPRVLWCGIDGEMDRLQSLQQAVERVCAGLGFEAETRAFSPHLTLGRVQGKRNLQQLLDYIKMAPEFEYTFSVNSFNIYRSDLTPRGARYSILETIELQTQR